MELRHTFEVDTSNLCLFSDGVGDIIWELFRKWVHNYSHKNINASITDLDHTLVKRHDPQGKYLVTIIYNVTATDDIREKVRELGNLAQEWWKSEKITETCTNITYLFNPS